MEKCRRILLQNTSNSLVEENEVYYFHRWGILIYGGSSNNEVRRNYVNGRGYDNRWANTEGSTSAVMSRTTSRSTPRAGSSRRARCR